jgi:hypothetical protein
MALTSGAEYKYFIRSEGCVCDVMHVLFFHADLPKPEMSGFNRSGWRVDV